MTAETIMILKAQGFGIQAFREGKSSVPALDRNVLALIGENDGHALVILKAWSHGWHTSNLIERANDPD